MKTLRCLRCGREWVPRTDHPLTCPECRSPYWNVPRRARPKAEEDQ